MFRFASAVLRRRTQDHLDEKVVRLSPVPVLTVAEERAHAAHAWPAMWRAATRMLKVSCGRKPDERS